MTADLKELSAKVVAVSRTYATRCGIERDDDWYVLKLQEELGELVAEYVKLTGRGRMKGAERAEVRAALEDEAADVLAHLLLLARHNDLDLGSALARKWFKYLPEDESGKECT